MSDNNSAILKPCPHKCRFTSSHTPSLSSVWPDSAWHEQYTPVGGEGYSVFHAVAHTHTHVDPGSTSHDHRGAAEIFVKTISQCTTLLQGWDETAEILQYFSTSVLQAVNDRAEKLHSVFFLLSSPLNLYNVAATVTVTHTVHSRYYSRTDDNTSRNLKTKSLQA